MTPIEIPSAVDRIAKNPHAVESMSKEDLYNIMTYINTQHGILAQTFHSIYGLNEKFQDVSFDVYLSRQSMIKELKKKFDIVETEYNKRISNVTPPGPETKLPKIKWCGKPSHLAYLINELIENGFIDAPKTKGDTSYKKMAELIMRTFEVETTEQNMQKELNPNKNTVGDVNRLRFKIPSISELD